MTEKKKIRLVYYGDAPCVATGFGKVSSNILKPLYDSGDYEIYCFGVNYMGVPHPFEFQIYPMLPNPQGDPYGREKIMHVLPEVEFDVAFFLQDSFIMTFLPDLIDKMKQKGKRFRTLAYFPIDGTPWPEWIQAMSAPDVAVTYTQWGKRECIKAYPAIQDKLHVIPHGINLQEFYPHPDDVRQQLRKNYFGQHADKFIVINVNRNQQRKDIPRSMLAFKEFKRECPNSVYYLHCAIKDVGWDLARVAQHMELKVGEDILFPPNFNVNQGYPVKVVNDLYNCADVCVSSTQGGGWELSGTEAMACKVPCIFPDNTALTEIFADGRGFLCRSGDTSNFFNINTMDNDILRPLMNITDMAKFLKRLYNKPEIGKKMADKAYKWVTENLIWGRDIVPKFDSLLKGLYEDLQKPERTVKEDKVSDSDWRRGSVV